MSALPWDLNAEPGAITLYSCTPSRVGSWRLGSFLSKTNLRVSSDLLPETFSLYNCGNHTIRMAGRALIATQLALIATRLAPIACVIDESMGRS